MDVRKQLTFIVIFSLVLFNSLLQAQNKVSHKKAKEYFRVEEYSVALPIYLKLDSLTPNNPCIKTRIGICYLQTENKYKALKFLEQGKGLGYTKDQIDFHLARAYHLNHQFDKAIASYIIAKKSLVDNSDDQATIRIDRLIEMCYSGKELVKNPIDVKIENLGNKLNSPYPEYAPVISADENLIIFTSRRPNTTEGKKDETGQYFEDIYLSVKENNEWTEPKNIGTNINTGGHEGSIGLSPDGQKLLLYKHDDGGDIYCSDLDGDKWCVPKKISGEVNTSKSWEPSASINANENIVFFSSDREGGYGGRDIYVSHKLPNNEWSTPRNLGPKINTKYEEDAPYIHPDQKTLYFSSQGHNSMGGFDIFTAEYNNENDSTTNAANIGYPINTADDDIYFIWSADGTRAYFSSFREDNNFGEKDLYKLTRAKANVSLIILKGKIYSKTNPITLKVTDLSKNQIVGIYNANSFTGKYTIAIPPGKNYSISIEAPKQLTYSENVCILGTGEYCEINKDIILQPLEEGSATVLKNVFFDSDSYNLQKESFTELDNYYKLLSENPNLRVEISGHTDNIGDEHHNYELSMKRARTVVKYFTDKGIDQNRLCAIGYGEKINIASNKTENGREKNRRTEIIILGNSIENNTSYNCYGFYNSKVTRNKVESKSIVTVNEIKNYPNIYFDFDKSTITNSSKEALELWSQYLNENKSLNIQIAGHTDCKGTDEYNNALAQKRTEAAIEYLISSGIAANRFKRINYGESKPVDTNETDEGRSKNRRVEIMILQ